MTARAELRQADAAAQDAEVWRSLALRAMADLSFCAAYLEHLGEPVPDSVLRTIDAVIEEARER